LLGKDRGFAASVDRLRSAFAGRIAVFPSCESGNTIAFATGGAAVTVALDDLRARALDVKNATGLDLLPTITRLQLGHPLPGGVLRI
jgi:spermidine synthase